MGSTLSAARRRSRARRRRRGSGEIFRPQSGEYSTPADTQQTYEAAGANSLRLEIVRRNPNVVGFEVIKRRWVVEQTFSWFGRNRRLAKDFEKLASTLLAFVILAAIQFGIRRLAR